MVLEGAWLLGLFLMLDAVASSTVDVYNDTQLQLALRDSGVQIIRLNNDISLQQDAWARFTVEVERGLSIIAAVPLVLEIPSLPSGRILCSSYMCDLTISGPNLTVVQSNELAPTPTASALLPYLISARELPNGSNLRLKDYHAVAQSTDMFFNLDSDFYSPSFSWWNKAVEIECHNSTHLHIRYWAMLGFDRIRAVLRDKGLSSPNRDQGTITVENVLLSMGDKYPNRSTVDMNLICRTLQMRTQVQPKDVVIPWWTWLIVSCLGAVVLVACSKVFYHRWSQQKKHQDETLVHPVCHDTQLVEDPSASQFEAINNYEGNGWSGREDRDIKCGGDIAGGSEIQVEYSHMLRGHGVREELRPEKSTWPTRGTIVAPPLAKDRFLPDSLGDLHAGDLGVRGQPGGVRGPGEGQGLGEGLVPGSSALWLAGIPLPEGDPSSLHQEAPALSHLPQSLPNPRPALLGFPQVPTPQQASVGVNASEGEPSFLEESINPVQGDNLRAVSSRANREAVSQNNPFGCEVVSCLGAGGYGVVYKARWQDRMVALKVLQHREGQLGGMSKARALSEAMLGSSLQHPNILATLGYSVVDAQEVQQTEREVAVSTYILMELCDRGTLRSLSRKRAWDPCGRDLEVALSVLLDVAVGVSYLHSRGIIHGDLKGNNVLLTTDETLPRGFAVKVADFGISRIIKTAGHSHTTMSRTRGTLSHMAPELIQHNQLSRAADVYAFGMVIYELTTGLAPFLLMNIANVVCVVTMGKVNEVLTFPDACPQELVQLAHRCWSKERQNRPSIGDVIRQLGAMIPKEYEAIKHRIAQILGPNASLDWDSPYASHTFEGSIPESEGGVERDVALQDHVGPGGEARGSSSTELQLEGQQEVDRSNP